MEGSPSSQAPDVDDARNTSLVVQDSSDVVCKEAVGGSAEVLGRGISSILENLISVFLDRAEGVGQSQVQLSNGIDRLTRELDQLLEDAPMPFIMQHASKISGLCKRVSSLNTILKSIQQRIDNIDHMLSLESSQGARSSEERKRFGTNFLKSDVQCQWQMLHAVRFANALAVGQFSGSFNNACIPAHVLEKLQEILDLQREGVKNDSSSRENTSHQSRSG